MANDPADFYTKAATINAAKFGGYGPKASKLGGLLDFILPAYEAATNAPFARMLNAGRQAYNVNQYNKALQAVAQEEKLRQEQELNRTLSDRRTFYPQLAKKGYTGQVEVPSDVFAAQREGDAIPTYQDMVDGKNIKFNRNAKYDMTLLSKMLERQGDVSNYLNQNAGLGAIGAGQKLSLTSTDSILNLGKGASGQAQPGVWDDGSGTPTLQGTASQTSFDPSQIIRLPKGNNNPFRLPTNVPSGIVSLATAGLNNAETAAQQKETNRHNTTSEKETGRHNLAEEGIGKTNAQAHMLSAQKAGGGGGSQPNQTTAIMGLASQLGLTPQQTLQALTDPKGFFGTSAGNKLTATDVKTLSEFKKTYEDNTTGWGFGPGRAANAQRAAENYNMLGDQFGLPHIGTPFKGQSQAKLKQAGSVAEQYGVKFR